MKKKIVASALLASALCIPASYAMEQNQDKEICNLTKKINLQWNNVLNEDEMTQHLIALNWKHKDIDAQECIKTVYELIKENLQDFINKDLASFISQINFDFKSNGNTPRSWEGMLLNSIAKRILHNKDDGNEYKHLQTGLEKLLYILEKGHFPTTSKHGRIDLQTALGNAIAEKLTNLFEKPEIATANDLFIKQWLNKDCGLISLFNKIQTS